MCEPSEGSRASPEVVLVLSACESELKVNNCEKLKTDHPNLATEGKLKTCDKVSHCTIPEDTRGFLRTCIAGWGSAWIDMGQALGDMLLGGASLSEVEKKRLQFLESCVDVQCKREMLKGFESYFTKEEIEGHGPTPGMDERDPAHTTYIKGHSAPVLYRKLLSRLKEQLNKTGSAESYIQPWSNQPAPLPRSPGEMIDFKAMIDAILLQAGLKQTACYTEEALLEMRCYALFSIIDPSIVVSGGLGGFFLVKKGVQLLQARRAVAAMSNVEQVVSRSVLHVPAKPTPVSRVEALPETVTASAVPQAPVSPAPRAPRHVQVKMDWKGHNPYIQDRHYQQQGLFLKRVGVKMDENIMRVDNPVQVAQNYNKIVEDLIASGKVKPNEALFWADPYIGSDGKLVFVRAGSTPPSGTEAFLPGRFKIKGQDSEGRNIYVLADRSNSNLESGTGFLSNADYYKAIADGYFPGSYESQGVQVESVVADGSKMNSIATPLFFHDLAHVGGMVDHPEMMGAFRKAMARMQARLQQGPVPPAVDQKINYVNEFLPGLASSGKKDFNRLVGSSSISPSTLGSFDNTVAAVGKLSKNELEILSIRVGDFHDKNRSAVGGGLRTGGSSEQLLSRLDRDAIKVREQLKGRVRLQGDLDNPKRTVEQKRVIREKIEEIESDLRRNLADYLFGTHALSQTNIRGWFDLATSEKPPYGAYRDFLCEGHRPELSQGC